jgi:benzoate/toluate 1,2-dioxygenase beta subunit
MSANKSDVALHDELEAFVYAEAELLDDGKFDDWLDLFADDGIYWIPAVPNQDDPLNTISIFYEDKDIMAIRIRRMTHPANIAQSPFPRTSHVVGQVRVAGTDNGLLEVSSRVQVVEYREGDGQRVFAGKCHHTLRREGDDLKIVLKRFDLVDCDAPHTFITIPL